MPTYEFECSTHGRFPIFFKAIPSERKQKEGLCPDCDLVSPRIPSAFAVTGGALPAMEKITGSSTDESGRPYFKDVNGRVQEIRSSKDIDKWCSTNALGAPRMVEYRNPKTGVKSWEALREGGIKSHPQTGEPLDGPVVRSSERLVPLDGGQSEYVPPSESRGGIPLDNGLLTKKPEEIPVMGGLLDPETKKPMTLKDCWGKEKL